MKYFEMIKQICDNDLEICFQKNPGGGMIVHVSKTVVDKVITETSRISPADCLSGNNNYIARMIVNVLSAEKEINLIRSNDSKAT